MIKKFLPFQNMVRADLFSGFWVVWDFAAMYSKNSSNLFCSSPRFARLGMGGRANAAPPRKLTISNFSLAAIKFEFAKRTPN